MNRSNHLKFSPDILRRLGEELVPNLDSAIMELVKNAYDADATSCTVELLNTEIPGGILRVRDDGIGMDEDALNSGWLILGRSVKSQNEQTRTAMGRLPVGEKGLGRLSALRSGHEAIISTRPKQNGGVEYTLSLDWRQFETVEAVEDVSLQILKSETDKPHGTDIEVRDLKLPIGEAEVQKVARAMLLLADPFDDKFGFHPRLVSPTFTKLAERVQKAYFDETEYRLVAELKVDGSASAKVLDWKGQELFSTSCLSTIPYRTSPAIFELWVYLLQGNLFTGRTATLTEVRKWLEVVGGVHLYERGIRVPPYGDPGHDWLDMNLERSRSPEERPSTNTSIGRVVILDPDANLIQKTDRSGHIENETFQELRRFAKDALRWMAKERLSAAENRRMTERVSAPEEVETARESIDQIIQTIPTDTRRPIAQALQQLERAREREVKILKEEVQLYRTLATVGTTAAVFAHEIGQPVTRILGAAAQINSLTQDRQNLFLDEMLQEIGGIINRAAQSLQSFSELPIRLLKQSKRRVGSVNAHAVLQDLMDMFQPFLTASQIETNLNLTESRPILLGSIAALEAIYANLLTNAVYAVVYGKGKVMPRTIVIRTEISGDRLFMHFSDDGPGITGIEIREIWLPGRTTKPGGIGLGLTIVRDAVSDLGGSIRALAHSELGGAEFIVDLPVLGATK
jgi:signal transduction histidine kinase